MGSGSSKKKDATKSQHNAPSVASATATQPQHNEPPVASATATQPQHNAQAVASAAATQPGDNNKDPETKNDDILEKKENNSNQNDEKDSISANDTNASSELDISNVAPTLWNMIQGNSPVKCLTSLGEEVYVTRMHRTELEVYSTKTKLALPVSYIHVSDANNSPTEMKSPQSMASCERYTCLYITDSALRRCFRVDLMGRKVISFDTLGEPEGVSVTRGGTVLITIPNSVNSISLKEFKSNGELLRDIPLFMTIDHPHHCLALSTGEYILCHGANNTQYRLCIVTREGRMLQSFGGPEFASNSGDVWAPTSLALDRHDNIIAVDGMNNKIQLFTPLLVPLQEASDRFNSILHQKTPQLTAPLAVHLDFQKTANSKGRLYVGDATGRLFMLDLG